MSKQLIFQVLDYHQASKHHPDKPSGHLPFLDWDHFPSPFLEFPQAEKIALPSPLALEDSPAADLFARRSQPLALEGASLSLFLDLALGISRIEKHEAWEFFFRRAPSCGNLQSAEARLLLWDRQGGFPTGLFHYQPKGHGLERLASYPPELRAKLAESWGEGNFVLGLSGFDLRQSWKFGIRAGRYGLLDLGHQLAACLVAAQVLGWKASLLPWMSLKALRQALGTDKTNLPPDQVEEPYLLLHLDTSGQEKTWPAPPASLLGQLAQAQAEQAAKALCSDLLAWAPVDDLRRLTRYNKPKAKASRLGKAKPWHKTWPQAPTAAEIICRRQSAKDFDPRTPPLGQGELLDLLDLGQQGPTEVPWPELMQVPAQPCLIFAHQVEALEPGCYLHLPGGVSLKPLKKAWSPRFLFEEVQPGLWLLEKGDARKLCLTQCFNQPKAAKAKAALVFLADLSPVLDDAHLYRRLHFGLGMASQSLYLGATALGLSASFLSAYYDDQMGEYLEDQTGRWQNLGWFLLGR